MTAKRGADLLLKYNSGTAQSPTWTTLGGLRSRSVRLGRTMLDGTTADSASLHRVGVSGGGVFSMTVSGDGVFEDSAAQGAVEAAVRAGTFLELQITIPGYGAYSGEFCFPDFNFDGGHDSELTFSITAESAGLITYTPAA
jgi:TP901-1 family phage major tail protein